MVCSVGVDATGGKPHALIIGRLRSLGRSRIVTISADIRSLW